LDFKVKQFLRGAPYDQALRNQIWLGAFDPAEQRALLNGGHAPADPYEDLRQAPGGRPAGDARRGRPSLSRPFLPDDRALSNAARASMATSLEVRAPFLDYTLVDWLGRVPSHLKLRGMTTKYLLKKAMAKRLPPGIAARRKKGFGIPVARWFKGELRELAC